MPEVLPQLSSKRLLTMTWLEGRRLLAYKEATLEERNDIARAMFRAWWYPFSHYGVIHGDPHLGNYTVFERDGRAAGINLLDYGCMRTFRVPSCRASSISTRVLEGKDLVVQRLRNVGLQGAHDGAHRGHEHLGALHLWAAAGGPRTHHRGRYDARRVRPARGVHSASDPARKGARGGAARVRLHGPRRHRPRRGSCTSARATTGTASSTRPSRVSASARSPSASARRSAQPVCRFRHNNPARQGSPALRVPLRAPQ